MMSKNKSNSRKSLGKGQAQDKKITRIQSLIRILLKPQTRRMAVTELGFDDQTYKVTSPVKYLIDNGHAQVLKKDKCKRSNHRAEYVTTNPKLFKAIVRTQLTIFDVINTN